jgi:hypothetical protein
MPTTIPDLWPPDVFVPAVVTPIAVLRQQGEALGSRTHNFVHGEVETTARDGGKRFTHTFYLSAPLLRYRVPLLNVEQQQLQPYPVQVVETDLTKRPDLGYWNHAVTNEAEFQDRLREFFNEPRVKEVVRAVLNMSNDVVPPEIGNRQS